MKLILATALFATALSTPTVKREVEYIDVYSQPNEGGNHQTLSSNAGQCYELYNQWYKGIQSIGLPPFVECTIYLGDQCSGQGLLLGSNPNGVEYTFQGTMWADAIASYKCAFTVWTSPSTAPQAH